MPDAKPCDFIVFMVEIFGTDISRIAECMPYYANSQLLTPADRFARLEAATSVLEGALMAVGAPADTGEYLQIFRVKTWLACLPSLRATALEAPHNADISEAVLANILPPMRQLAEDTAEHVDHGIGGDSAHGFLGELAVLGSLLWAHTTDPDRALHRVLPATADQDRSGSQGRRSGFDLLLDSAKFVTPLQVKSSDSREAKIRAYGGGSNRYQRNIAKIYISRLLGLHSDSYEHLYAPQLLADAVLRRDEDVLTQAIEGIDLAVQSAEHRKVHVEEFYRDLV